jgi:hypothetical protein
VDNDSVRSYEWRKMWWPSLRALKDRDSGDLSPRPFGRWAQFGLFLAVFCFFLTVQSREPPWNDAKPIYAAATNFAFHGRVDASGETVPKGKRTYDVHPFLASAIHVPGALFQRLLLSRFPQDVALAKIVSSHLGPAALGGLAAVLFVRLCLFLGLGLGASLVSSVVLVMGTMVGVYARVPWSEMVQAVSFLGFFSAFMRVLRDYRGKAVLVLGVWCGAIVNSKELFVLAVPGAFLLALWHHRDTLTRKETLRCVGLGLLGAAPFLVIQFIYNTIRTGSPFRTAYGTGAVSFVFGTETLDGFLGLWASPGKSIFLYNPPLVFALFGIPLVVRRCRLWATALAVTAIPVVLVYGKFMFWSGDWCWGPRYLLFLVPLLLLPGVFLVDEAIKHRRVVVGVLATAVFVLGIGVQVIGSSLYWDHYIRVEHNARAQWLGAPDRTGNVSKPGAKKPCDPCFEDFYGLNWLPPFSPLAGQYWMAKHIWRGDSWDVAEADGPWHRYTTIPLTDIAVPYARGRLDWWYLEFSQRQAYRARLLQMILYPAGLLFGVFLCWRGASRRKPGAAAVAEPAPEPVA